MAGGIDWFRWHHGSVTDPKFGLVAKKARCRTSDVIAVWAFLLETASCSSDRGSLGDIDLEAIEHLLALDEGQAGEIVSAMTDRKLLVDGRVVSWEKRQPAKEDATAADRKRNQREKQALMARIAELESASVTGVKSREVTASHDESRDVTLEKSREEKKKQDQKTAPDGELFDGVDPVVASDFKALRTKQRAPVTATAMAGIRREAAKAGLTLQEALAMCCERGWRGFKAEWVKDAGPPGRKPASDPNDPTLGWI